MRSEGFLLTGVILLVSGSVLPLFSPRARGLSFILASLGAVAFGMLGIRTASGQPVHIPPLGISSVFEFHWQADPLSGFFLAVISLLLLAVSVYSIGYTRGQGRVPLMCLLYNLFALSMYAVVLAGNFVTFLIAWETMTIVSYFLVTFERDEKSSKAGLIYATMTHVGTAFLVALFLLLYGSTGGMDFAAMREGSAAMPIPLRHAVFLFAVVGFGMKAGVIPFHTWLPRAHPAAPSNVSALMSGVMIKTGIYGFLRIAVDVLGQGPEWWGLAVVAMGAVSSIFGVLYALMEHDMKRLLAYHSVENIGIILLGVGAAMMFRSHGLLALSAVALAAGLFHTLNHALFKGLLFLGAGSVVKATGTKDMERMGGLIKAMPLTGLFFLVGSLAICALPPFNGFVSEWLTYQSLILGLKSPTLTSKILLPLGGAALALTGALAAACFVKAFGIAFLGMPRAALAGRVRETSPTMVAGMALLAALCLLLGVMPSAALRLMSPAVSAFTGAGAPTAGVLRVEGLSSSIWPLGIAAAMAAFFLAGALLLVLAGGRARIARRGSWDCGMPSLSPRMQYTASGFSQPLRMIFKRIYLPSREVSISYLLKPFFVESVHYRGEITPFFERYFYDPIVRFFHALAGKARLLQSGSLHLYLCYILITLLVLLVFWS
jgi:hydrogenase-4 component B